MMSIPSSVVSLLLTWIVSSCGLNITVLVIRSRVNTPSKTDVPGNIVSQFDSVNVCTVDDVSIFTFWQTDYKTMTDWLVVMDTRTQSCPYQLFQKRLLGYISLYPGPCDLTNMTSVFRVQTMPFDYRHLVMDVGNNSGTKSNSVAFLFDESGREYQEQVSMRPFQHFLFYLELPLSLDDVQDLLANLAVKTDVRYVFIMATASSIEHVLREAQRLNMLRGRYHWLLFATDGVTPIYTNSIDHSIVLIKDSHNMLATNGQNRLMRLFDDVVEEMSDVMTSLSSPVCDCVESCGTCKTLFRNSLYKMAGTSAGVFLRDDMVINSVDFQLYNYVGNETDSLMQVATWSENGGLVPKGNLFVGGSNKVVLRVAAVVEPPFVLRNESGGYYGYSIDVLDAIADIVDFTYTVKECDDGHYGLVNANGVWTGCISNIVNGDSDIIAGAMTVTADREAVVDFTLPYYDFAGIQIIMRKRNTAINLFYFADVFTPLAWLCLGAVIAVTSLLLMLLDRYAPSSKKHERTEDGETQHKTFDLKESIWFVMGSLTMTGAGAPPDSFSARLLVAGFWFFSVIMMSTFTANLAAFLTVSRMGVTISSLSELAGQSDIKYSVVADSTVMTYFQRMAAIEENFYSIWKEMSLGGGTNTSLAVWDYPLGDTYVNIWKTMQETGLLNSTDQAINKILQENFAYIADSPVIKYLTYRNCELTAIGDMFSIRPYAFALKEKSIYTKKISSAILELQKGRKLEAFKRRWWDDGKLDCPASSTDQGLDLKSLTGSFIVVALGIASGLLVLSMEHLWNRCSKKKTPVLEVKPRYSSNASLGDVSRNTDVTVLGDKESAGELSDLPEG